MQAESSNSLEGKSNKNLTLVKSLSNLLSEKDPLKKSRKSSSKELFVNNYFLNPHSVSPKNKQKKVSEIIAGSLTPMGSHNITPLSYTSTQHYAGKNLPCLVMKTVIPKLSLKNFDLTRDLEYTQKVLGKQVRYKANSCLENVIGLDEQKNSRKSLEDCLKFVTGVLRDMIFRMDEIGKSNEAALLDKLWRVTLTAVDESIESFKDGNIDINFSSSTLLDKDLLMYTKLSNQDLEGGKERNKSRENSLRNRVDEANLALYIERIEKTIEELDLLCVKKESEKQVDEEIEGLDRSGRIEISREKDKEKEKEKEKKVGKSHIKTKRTNRITKLVP